MKKLREKIITTVIDNVMIEIDNTGKEKYTLDEVQFTLLIDNLTKESYDILFNYQKSFYSGITDVKNKHIKSSINKFLKTL